MRPIKEYNYFLNVALFIIGFVCIISGLLLEAHRPIYLWGAAVNLKELHTWTGYSMALLILVHLLLHAGWICTATRQILQDRKKFLVLLLVVMISLVVCYLPLKLAPSPFPGGSRLEEVPRLPTSPAR